MEYGWRGELIRLVPLDIEKHFEETCKWINTPELTRFLLPGDFPLTKIAEKEWFEKASAPNRNEVIFAVETLDGIYLGNSGIHGIDYQNGFAVTGTFLGRADLWGRGYGTDAAIVRARYAFDVLGLRLLFSCVFEGNKRSLKMQEKAGYEIYGTAPKKYWKRGAYCDEILTVLSRERFLKLHPK